jgi:molybdopterin/thiamine biosynthesis adenylyltransferase
MPLDLDADQLDRYSRHVIMDEVGPEGQAALLDSAVLVVGAGGLGSPAIQYLAAAGVGRLGIADGDTVERSNLQRQTIHGVDDLGRPKVESAAEFVAALNPEVAVESHETAVTAGNATGLVADYDFVLDCTDNFPTRFLLNDACVLADRPLSNGAVYRFEGQVTTFEREGPCYRCLFPEAPDPGTVPNCAEVGILGVLPGVVGGIQATEAIKHLVGVGETLSGRLLVYDAAGMSFEEVPVRRDPGCPVCGEDAGVESVAEVEYQDSCAVPE